MMIKCTTCGKPISKGWLFLGLPWSTYTCTQCGSVFAGTFLRMMSIAFASGILGYVSVGVIKGKMNPIYLLPLGALTLILLFFNLPKQIKKIEKNVQLKGKKGN